MFRYLTCGHSCTDVTPLGRYAINGDARGELDISHVRCYLSSYMGRPSSRPSSADPADRDRRLRRAIADRLAAARAKSGVTQEAFAEAAGWRRTHIHHVERGGTATIDTVYRWCRACGTGVDPWKLLRDAYAEVEHG